jgi:hypothetical protein
MGGSQQVSIVSHQKKRQLFPEFLPAYRLTFAANPIQITLEIFLKTTIAAQAAQSFRRVCVASSDFSTAGIFAFMRADLVIAT